MRGLLMVLLIFLAGLAHAQAPYVQLMDPAKEKRLRVCFRKVMDDDVQRKLDDPRLILFTDEEIPPAYQNWSRVSSGIHSPLYNISGNADPVGNAAREFPWNTPMGTAHVRNFRKFRALWLPPQADGTAHPILYWAEPLRKYNFGERPRDFARFCHPVDATYFEILTLQDSQRRDWTFEIRVRMREDLDWAVDVFRPVLTWKELTQAIRAESGWEQNALLRNALQTLETKPVYQQAAMRNSRRHSRVTIDARGFLEYVPDLPEAFVIKLLSREPWASAAGTPWRAAWQKNEVDVHAASTKSRFNIVPADYDAGLVEVSRESCGRCHNSTNKHVSFFGPIGRDWYGNVHGFDGQFTFHGWDRRCISPNGATRFVQMSRELSPIFRKVDAAWKSDARYRRIPGVE